MSDTELQNDNRYLIYRIGGELYGTPLLEVREVVEYQKPKFMPNMESHFSGVINIRGSIVGVVDLRSKFGISQEISKSTALLVCESEKGPIAAIVDKVESVLPINKSERESKPPILSKVDSSYLIGVAKINEKLCCDQFVMLRPAPQRFLLWMRHC